MGRILLCGSSGKRSRSKTCPVTTYIDNLDKETKSRYIEVYGLQHLYHEAVSQSDETSSSEDAAFELSDIKDNSEVSPDGSSSITTIEAYTPVFDSSEKDSCDLTATARVFYEVDLDRTNELHSSLSLDIVRNQLKASSQVDKASKQLVGLDGKHPSAVCGVLCKKIITQKSCQDEEMNSKSSLTIRLRCRGKNSGKDNSDELSLDSKDKSSSSNSLTPEHEQVQNKDSGSETLSPKNTRKRTRSKLVAQEAEASQISHESRVADEKVPLLMNGNVSNSVSKSCVDAPRRGRSSLLARVLPRPRSRSQSKEACRDEIEVNDEINPSLLPQTSCRSEDKESSIENKPVDSLESPETKQDMGNTTQPSSPTLPKRRPSRPQRYLDTSPVRSQPEKLTSPSRRTHVKKNSDKEAHEEVTIEENKENDEDDTLLPPAATEPVIESKQEQQPKSAGLDPVPCEICEMVNKQRPVFYFHGHQVCRVCSNFLTSTLRKLTNVHDAACIYDSTCDTYLRYCRSCRLHKFLRVGFDLSRFGKMRGFPQIIHDLNLTSLVEPSVIHKARLTRVADYAKFLNSWRTEVESDLQYAPYTSIPPVTSQKPPPKKPSPSKHRRPIWHEEEAECEDESPSKGSSYNQKFEFDKQKIIPLSKEVPFSCDICCERDGELFRIDNKSTVCSECLHRYQSLLKCHSNENTSFVCVSGVSNCANLSTCQACFFERCRPLIPESSVLFKPPSPSKESDLSIPPRTKTLFESRIPGSEATALADLECVICRLIAASTKGQLNFYHIKFSPDAECEEGKDKEGITVCEFCLWNYQWRVEEARTVEELICPKDRACRPHECHACLVQKCRAILPLHEELQLPDWIKSIMFECLSINQVNNAATEDDSERSKRVCKVKNATIPDGSSVEPSHAEQSRSRSQNHNRGRGRVKGLNALHSTFQRRGKGRSKIGVSKVRTKMPSSMHRRRSAASSEGRCYEDEVDNDDRSDEDLEEESTSGRSQDKPRRSHRKRRTARVESSDDAVENDDDDDEEGVNRSINSTEESNSTSHSEESSRGQSNDDVLTTTKILRAGGTKGPRIKQVSRHAATVFSRAKKGESENSKSSRRKGKLMSNGDVKLKQKGSRNSSQPNKNSVDPSNFGSKRMKNLEESEHFSDASSEFNLNEVVNFAPVTPDRQQRRNRNCGRCAPCRKSADCGKCRACRLMTKFGGFGTLEKCYQRICNERRAEDASYRSARESQATAWVRELQLAGSLRRKTPPDNPGTGTRTHQHSGQHSALPVHKVSGAPPSNTLWNTVHGLSRQIDDAHSSGIYGDQEIERIRCNLAERQTTNLAWDGGIAVVTTRKNKPPGELCYLCGSAGPHKMINCVSCAEPFHWFCLEYADRPRSTTETAIWLCRNCKPCLLCHHTGGVLTCVSCWKGFHARCLPGYGPAQQPNRNAWLCPGCAVCNRCGSCAADILHQSGTMPIDNLPLSARSRQWSLDPGQCAECEEGAKKGNVCPVCQRIYTDSDQEMIQCSECNLWVHALCAGLRNEDYHALSSMNPRHLSKLIFVCRRCEDETGRESNGNLQTSARVELRTRVRTILHSMAAREVEMVEETKAIEEGFASRCQAPEDEDDDDIVPQVDGVIDMVPDLQSEVEVPVHVELLFPALVDKIERCEPWSEDDPLRYGLSSFVKRILYSLEDKVASDHFGLQYQTYLSLGNEFETQLGQQLTWFDLQSVKKKMHNSRKIRGSYNCAGSTVGDGDPDESDEEVIPINRSIEIELHELASSIEQMEADAEDSDTLWMDYWYRYDRYISRSSFPDDPSSDQRGCALCRRGNETSMAGRLLFCGQDMWVHANCALWSNEVYETEEGSLRHVGEAVMRGGNTHCSMCKQRGATLSCCGEEVNCQRSYHFLCGIRACCIFTVDRAFFCSPLHAVAVSEGDTLSIDDLAVCRRVLIHRDGFRNRKNWVSGLAASQIRINIGALAIDWLGRIDEASDSLTSFLCPVGFRCTRMYWSTTNVNERVPYKLSVRQTNVNQDMQSDRHSTTVHAPPSPVRAPSPELQPQPLTFEEESSPPPSMMPAPSQTETLADRLQRLSREMVAAKQPPVFSASGPIDFSSTLPTSAVRTEPAPRTSARKSQHVPLTFFTYPPRPPPKPVPYWGSIGRGTKSPDRHHVPVSKPLITCVRSLADEEKDAQNRRTVCAISPPADHVGSSIWKTPTHTSVRPTARIIPSCERPQRAERATVQSPVSQSGMPPKRPNPEPVREPETKRLRLTNAMEPVSKPPNKLVVTRKVSGGKTIYVCVKGNGLPVPTNGTVQKVVHPVHTVVCGNNNGSLVKAPNILPKHLSTTGGSLSLKIDKIVDRVLVNPPLNPPPQLDGCVDEDDNQSAIKDPPKLKTRWIEERDKKDNLKNYLANLPNNAKRRKANAEDAHSEHLAAISRAKRKHDERRYRKATADVQESFWLSFCVEYVDLPYKINTMSPRMSWKQVTSRVKDLRYESGWRHPYIFGVDGWSQWGLSHRMLSYIIEQMEGAYLAYRHRFIYHRKKIEALRELNAPPVPCKRGCARSEPYPKQAWRLHETFSFLLCSVNHSGTSLAPSQTGISIDDEMTSTGNNVSKIFFSAPLATRLRQLSCQRGRDVEVFKSPIHCRGLFALHSFAKDEMITEYLGEVIRSIVCEERERKYQEAHVDCFMFRIDSESVIDATMKGNAARFINHSCNPNCYSRVITMPDTTKHIVILAQRDIQRGEELTYDYKFPPEDDKIPCHCGAPSCRRFLN